MKSLLAVTWSLASLMNQNTLQLQLSAICVLLELYIAKRYILNCIPNLHQIGWDISRFLRVGDILCF